MRVNIDQGKILNIVKVSVRRASAFMALGLRISNDETVESLWLGANFQMHFLPKELPIEQVREFQREFRPWIIGNGLRELDQATSIFAGKVFEVRTLVNYHGQGVPPNILNKIKKFKNGTSVAEKLQTIAKKFGIETDLQTHMPALSKARNALSHNMGIVGKRHCTHDGELRMTWMGIEISIGDRVISDDFKPFYTEQEETPECKFIDRKSTYLIDNSIELSPQNLHEICYTYLVQAQNMMEQFGHQLEEMGIGSADG